MKLIKMKKIFILFFIFITYVSLSQAQWNLDQVGIQPGIDLMDIEIADGRNDGLQRIYVSSNSGNIYEWSYNGIWNNTLVSDGNYPGLINMAIGNGRNDGQNRLYFNEHTSGGRVFEMSWNGNSWIKNLVTTLDSLNAPTSIIVGDGRGDGVGRLYIGGYPWGVTEYTWNGNYWSADTVLTTSYSESDGVIGNARNDIKNRLYINGDCPIEAEYNGSWSDQYIVSCSPKLWADALHIGDGRNDGVMRLYSNTEAGGKREFTWNGSSWDEVLISMNGWRGDIHLAALKSDNLNRLYVSGSVHWTGSPAGADLVEYEWNVNTLNWDSTGVVVDAITGATGWVASGNGRNDDTLRLYAPNFNTGIIHEITSVNPNYIQTTTISDIVQSEIKIFPNPAEDNIIVSIDKFTDEKIHISITNVLGKIFYSTQYIPKSNHYIIDINQIPSGIYIVEVSINGFSFFERLVKK